MRNRLIFGYLRYIRGDAPRSFWRLIAPLGYVGRLCSRIRNVAYDRGLGGIKEPPLPVISVGNLSLGGTNKTPFVAMVARKLLDMGLSPGIVSRGYGGAVRDTQVLHDGQGERDLVGDEPLLLSSSLPGVPVALSPNRYEGVEALVQEGCSLVVADDAFQHRRMGRDVDILLIDATCPFGNERHFPGGLLREGLEGIARAHLVVITKSDQVPREERDRLKERIACHIPKEKIFLSRLILSGWYRFFRGELIPVADVPRSVGGSLESPPQGLLAFSAIGNPESFRRLLEDQGVHLREEIPFRDHHRFSPSDLAFLEERARTVGAAGLVCTEKDIWNLPEASPFEMPLYVPRVCTWLEEEGRFWNLLAELLRPRLVVASNGYGEDAVGAALARILRKRFPSAEVGAFALVGAGAAYGEEKIPVYSPPAESPSGGIVKYSLRTLLHELRGGLLGNIRSQLTFWEPLRGRIRTVLCVGDVYLLLHTLGGQGQLPVLLATAKSVRLGGHWRVERFLLRLLCRLVWTRDGETARELAVSGVEARFEGNPLMDIASPEGEEKPSPWDNEGGPRVLLLPGSRLRAYEDLRLLLQTLEILYRKIPSLSCRLVIAPTLKSEELSRIVREEGWCEVGATHESPLLWTHPGGCRISLHGGSLVAGALGADLLIGLGGTANQVCAGLGIPVLSIREKGKLVQKKLLGDAEVLVPRDPQALAQKAWALWEDPEERTRMGQAGREAMGSPGSLERIAATLDAQFGWGNRCAVYDVFRRYCGCEDPLKEE
jgi:tetraacyldisaccharide 4'-kinase